MSEDRTTSGNIFEGIEAAIADSGVSWGLIALCAGVFGIIGSCVHLFGLDDNGHMWHALRNLGAVGVEAAAILAIVAILGERGTGRRRGQLALVLWLVGVGIETLAVQVHYLQ